MSSKQNPVQISPLLGWAAELKSYEKVEVGSPSLIVCTVSVVSFGGSCHKYNFCCDKSLLVVAKDVFCRNKSKLVLSQQK